MRIMKYGYVLMLLSLIGCIGDDFIDDFVEPELRIVSGLDTLGVGERYQLDAQFFNNVGIEEIVPLSWETSDASIVSITETGELTGIGRGMATVTVSAAHGEQILSSAIDVIVDAETVMTSTERMGTLRTTSSYTLRGGFVLSAIEGGIRLSIDDSYITDDVLPGLYVYLTNNPNSVRDALPIQEVTIFEGAHSYEIADVGLDDYSHVLYFCKPFNVKVGDGEIK